MGPGTTQQPVGRERGEAHLGGDEVFDVLQREHVALGAVFGAAAGLNGRGFLGGVPLGLRAIEAGDAGDCVAADGNPLAAFHDADGVDEVIHLGLPEDGFEDAAGGGSRHDGVADALHLHLGTSKQAKPPQTRRLMRLELFIVGVRLGGSVAARFA